MSEERKTIEVLQLKVRLEIILGNNIEAVITLGSLIQKAPERAESYFQRAKLYHDQNLFDLAIDDINQFLQLPKNTTTAVLFFQDLEGQRQTSIKTSNMLTSEALVIRGLCYRQLGQYEKAEADFIHAISEDSTADKFVNLAMIKLENSDTIAAERLLIHATELSETYGLAWYNLLMINSEVSIPPEVGSDGAFLPLLKYRCIEAIRDKEFDLAENLLAELMSLRPEDDEVIKIAGDYYYSIQDYDVALEFYKSLTKGKRANDLNLKIANAYYQLQLFDEAIGYYEIILASKDASPHVWFNAAVAYKNNKDLQNACRCIRRIDTDQWSHPQLEKFKRLCE